MNCEICGGQLNTGYVCELCGHSQQPKRDSSFIPLSDHQKRFLKAELKKSNYIYGGWVDCR